MLKETKSELLIEYVCPHIIAKGFYICSRKLHLDTEKFEN